MQVTDIVRAKLKNVNSLEDSDIELGIEEAEQFILNYCNITEVPEAANFVWANMSVDLINYQVESKKDVTSASASDYIDPSAVTMIKEGDVQINVGGPGASNSNARSKILKGHIPVLDKLLMNYKLQLEDFRKLY